MPDFNSNTSIFCFRGETQNVDFILTGFVPLIIEKIFCGLKFIYAYQNWVKNNE